MQTRSRWLRGLIGAGTTAALTVAALAATPVHAGCSAKSGANTTALIELYTSEGCSSCPPADRWLSSTFRDPADARAAALAFHVDYWDRLGWKDRFASAAYTDRQYAAMHAGASRFVYTPQVMIQGHDFPDWMSSSRVKGPAAAIAAAHAAPARASISLAAEERRGALAVTVAASVPDAASRAGAALYLALTQDGLATEVKAGENAGVRLTHDHVVRAFRKLADADAKGALAAEVELPLPADGERRFTLVAFVQNPANGDTLQTLALPLPAGACTL